MQCNTVNCCKKLKWSMFNLFHLGCLKLAIFRIRFVRIDHCGSRDPKQRSSGCGRNARWARSPRTKRTKGHQPISNSGLAGYSACSSVWPKPGVSLRNHNQGLILLSEPKPFLRKLFSPNFFHFFFNFSHVFSFFREYWKFWKAWNWKQTYKKLI